VRPLKDALAEGTTPPLALLRNGWHHAAGGVRKRRRPGAQRNRVAAPRIVVRAALGAGRARIARQLLRKPRSIRAGAVLGIAAAIVAVKLVIVNAPVDVYGIERATVRPAVIAIAALAALLSDSLLACRRCGMARAVC
jgi:hypothetical protein